MASFISIISELEDGLEDLEEQLLSPEQADMLGIENIQQYRRNFRVIKKCILPLKEEISKLLHPIDNDLLHKASRPFFNDVNDHLQFVLQTLDAVSYTHLDVYKRQAYGGILAEQSYAR